MVNKIIIILVVVLLVLALGAGAYYMIAVKGKIKAPANENTNTNEISNTNTNIKQNHPCLLRHGVEINANQSFIACISDALYFGEADVENVKSIPDMKEHIISFLNIDDYIIYQNGNLVPTFLNHKISIIKNADSILRFKRNVFNNSNEYDENFSPNKRYRE